MTVNAEERIISVVRVKRFTGGDTSLIRAKELNGYGFEKLMEFDKNKYTIELEAKKAVK